MGRLCEIAVMMLSAVWVLASILLGFGKSLKYTDLKTNSLSSSSIAGALASVILSCWAFNFSAASLPKIVLYLRLFWFTFAENNEAALSWLILSNSRFFTPSFVSLVIYSLSLSISSWHGFEISRPFAPSIFFQSCISMLFVACFYFERQTRAWKSTCLGTLLILTIISLLEFKSLV